MIDVFQNVLHVCFTVFTIYIHVFIIWKKHYLFLLGLKIDVVAEIFFAVLFLF